MISYSTVEKLINNYDSIVLEAKRNGWVNLGFYYDGSEELDHLSVFAEFDREKVDPICIGRDIEEVLSNYLEIPVVLVGEGSYAATPYVKNKAKNAPLADMEKTINYFFDTLIPYSFREEPNEESESQRKELLKLWNEKHSVNRTKNVSSPSSSLRQNPASYFASSEEILSRLVNNSELTRLLVSMPEETFKRLEECLRQSRSLREPNKMESAAYPSSAGGVH